MSCRFSVHKFIAFLAKRMASVFPNNYIDEDDYIQVGHLALEKIKAGKYKKRDFDAYAVTTIARDMRDMALDTICAVSAPLRVKRLIYKIKTRLDMGKTEVEIGRELRLTSRALSDLQSLITTESLQTLFQEPTHDSQPFSILDDLLMSGYLTKEDMEFIQAKLNGTHNCMGLSRKQQWLMSKNIRFKLIRGGYDATN